MGTASCSGEHCAVHVKASQVWASRYSKALQSDGWQSRVFPGRCTIRFHCSSIGKDNEGFCLTRTICWNGNKRCFTWSVDPAQAKEATHKCGELDCAGTKGVTKFVVNDANRRDADELCDEAKRSWLCMQMPTCTQSTRAHLILHTPFPQQHLLFQCSFLSLRRISHIPREDGSLRIAHLQLLEKSHTRGSFTLSSTWESPCICASWRNPVTRFWLV